MLLAYPYHRSIIASFILLLTLNQSEVLSFPFILPRILFSLVPQSYRYHKLDVVTRLLLQPPTLIPKHSDISMNTMNTNQGSSTSMRSTGQETNPDSDEDNIWAFTSLDSTNFSLSAPPKTKKASKYGQIYTIDLTVDDMYKQVKPQHQRRDGESSTRYVYNLGALKMKQQQYQNGDNNNNNNNGDDLNHRKDDKILCLHRHKIWWMKPLFLGHSNGIKMSVPPETIFLLGLDNDNEEDDLGKVKKKENKEENEGEEKYRLVLPMILPDKNGCTSCSLRSSAADTNLVELHSDTGGKVAVYCGISADPFKLIEDAIHMASTCSMSHYDQSRSNTSVPTSTSVSIKTPSSLPMNKLPSFANKLGWCTWNAFYTQLNGEKIISAVKTLQDRNIPIKWMIVDDGWQHTTNDKADDGMQWGERLVSVNGSSPSKFTQEDAVDESLMKDANANSKSKPVQLLSLKETVSRLKYTSQLDETNHDDDSKGTEEGIALEAVLAWHALPGYWLGLANEEQNINYNGPNTTLHYPHFPTNIIDSDSSIVREQSIMRGIGIANNATLFFDQYHSFLEECGFDGVKVDAQGVCGFLRPHTCRANEENEKDEFELHRHQVSYHLQDALASSIVHRFSTKRCRNNKTCEVSSTNNIMCMSHSPEIIYRLKHLYSNAKPLMRASDDFYPENDYCHGPHLVACAFNSLLIGHLSVPDWDMFTTESSVTGEMHAMARAISGGPIYFSDKPYEADPLIIERLACKNGIILSCCDFARPTRKSLFNDPLDKDSSPMIIWNVNGRLNDEGNDKSITSGVLGIFHLGASGKWCYDKLNFIQSQDFDQVDKVKTINISPADIEHFRHRPFKNYQFVAVCSQDGLLGVIPSVHDSLSVKVRYLQSHLVHILPIHQVNHYIDFVALGITDLYNFAGVVKKVSYTLVTQLDNVVHDEDSTSNIGKEKKKIRITIDTFGCGDFLIAYKFKTSFKINTIHVYLNGTQIPHDLIDPKLKNLMLPRIEGNIISSFLENGFDIHCIKIPCKNNNDVSILDIVIE